MDRDADCSPLSQGCEDGHPERRKSLAAAIGTVLGTSSTDGLSASFSAEDVFADILIIATGDEAGSDSLTGANDFWSGPVSGVRRVSTSAIATITEDSSPTISPGVTSNDMACHFDSIASSHGADTVYLFLGSEL